MDTEGVTHNVSGQSQKKKLAGQFALDTCRLRVEKNKVEVMNSPEVIAQEQMQFAVDNQDDCFYKTEAELYGITKQEQFVKIASADDVYQMLNNAYNCENYVGLSIHTTGMAAPLNENGEIDVPPSEHPYKRRVSLISVITDEGFGSALAFADDGEIITDAGEASGSLADALLICWERSKA